MDINRKIITLNNNEKYFVLEELNYNNNEYCLLLNIDNENDMKISQKEVIDEKTVLNEISDETLKNELSKQFKESIEKTQSMYA